MNKSTVFVVLILALFTSYAEAGSLEHSAVESDPVLDLNLGEQASHMTQPLINQLRLNEGEYIRLRRIHKILLAAIDDINTQYASQPVEHRAKLEELQSYYEQERIRVLTPTQVGRLEERTVQDSMPVINTESGGMG